MEELFEQYSPDEENPFYWIIPGELGGRCGPEMKEWNLDQLWEIGFRGIASVHRLPKEEEKKLEGSDFNHLRIYFPAMALGREGLRKKFLTLTDDYFEFVDEHLDRNEAVLTHCYAGLDRTSCLIGCYLISRYDHTAEQAIKKIKQNNSKAFVSPGYEEAVMMFEKKREET